MAMENGCFFGVYLLYCENPRFKGRTYIGFTVNPKRRISQHNRGKKFGGAWKTSNRGPWKMVLIIHGFPNDIAALRFEWAWQHPQDSRRLRHVSKKKSNERMFDYCLRVLSEMLRVGPWYRLPLTIRWLEPDFQRDFSPGLAPPMHMPICYGAIDVEKPVPKKKCPLQVNGVDRLSDNDVIANLVCFICRKNVDKCDQISCLSRQCAMASHMDCLARKFLEKNEYVPIEGECPKCCMHVLWGDLLKKTDFYQHFVRTENYADSDNDNDGHSNF